LFDFIPATNQPSIDRKIPRLCYRECSLALILHADVYLARKAACSVFKNKSAFTFGQRPTPFAKSDVLGMGINIWRLVIGIWASFGPGQPGTMSTARNKPSRTKTASSAVQLTRCT
jgi:hypothetical protein